MNTVLLVTADEALRARLIQCLSAFSVFEANSDKDALRTLRLVDIDVIVRESVGPIGALPTFTAAVREIAAGAMVVAVGPSGEDDTGADFVIQDRFIPSELETALRHALDRRRLVRELAAARASVRATPPMPNTAEDSWEGAELARVLRGFTGVLSAGFDLPRAFGMFLDAIGELVRPTRVALLVPDSLGRDFRIAANRSLAPQLVQGLRLSADEGLMRWLAVEGRPLTLTEAADAETIRELKLLQATVAVPLLAHGELVAVLALGQPVFGTTYGRREMQTLFDLAAHLATVIRDIALHHQLAREKEFNERILSHMSSGVVTIGHDEKVGALNRRAEEILDLSAAAVVGQDLRLLPSPLGDMLYDTLASGRPVPRTEIQLALRRLWLEVSTYAVRGEDGQALGAVLVFEDLTAQKELAAQRREADQFQLLTRVVARIADEIKNPLVSINTFIELIGERYDDPDFRRHFSSVVRRDVRRLVEVFEKLAGLVTEGELNFAVVDAREVVGQLVDAIDLADEASGKHLHLDVIPEAALQLVKVDAVQLRKALSYLVRYLTHNSPTEQAKVTLSVGRHEDREGSNDVRIMVGSRTATVAPEKLQRLFDPVQMVQESLIDVGPAVSQRLIEALGGQLRLRQTRHELAFLVTLPAMA
jgi:PAS domain S-box-containing protein